MHPRELHEHSRAIAAPRVLCAGSVVQDTIVRSVEELRWGTTTFVESMERCVGGNGANTARALAILGARVRLAGGVGDDHAAEFVVNELRATGVETDGLQRIPQPNAATVVLVNAQGDRQFLHRLGSSAEVFAPPFALDRALLGDMQHLHLASLFVLPHLRKRAPELLAAARVAGLTTSLDTNWDPHGEWMRVLEPCLEHVDILFLNEDESRMLTGTQAPEIAASRMQDRGASTVVQKLGREGCAIFPREGVSVHCPAYEVQAIDTTGAGDCFAAAFLCSHLTGGTLQESGDHGNAAGALSTLSVGSVAGLLPSDEIHAWKAQAGRRPPPGSAR
jgi:sugar/nucleoside kinase (ribokinase family)